MFLSASPYRIATAKKKSRSALPLLSIFSLLLIVAGILGLFLVQQPLLETPQDLRQQASVEDGVTEITTQLRGSTTNQLSVGENIIDIYLYAPMILDELDLVFSLISGSPDYTGDRVAFTQPPELTLNSELFNGPPEIEVEQGTNSYLIKLKYTGLQDYGFGVTPATRFASLRFTYTGATEEEVLNGLAETEALPPVSLVFDPEFSHAYRYFVVPREDLLTHIGSAIFAAPAVAQPSSEPSPTPTPTPTPTLTPTPTPSASPTPTPETLGVGGATVSSCNQSCSSNHDCDVNLRCYEGSCRLATNVFSQSCQTSATTSEVTASCNQSCSSNFECATGLTCFANRCRNPLNLESLSCAAPSETVVQTMSASCNQSCESHRDCPANMLCEANSKTCRLASNPSSSTCTPASTKTTSGLYETKGGPTSNDQGGSATESASLATGAASLTDTSTPLPITSEETMDQNPDKDSTDSNALETLLAYLRTNPTIWVIALAVGGGMLAIILLLILAGSVMNKRRLKKTTSADGPRAVSPQMAATEKKLEQEIAALQAKTQPSLIQSSPIPPQPQSQPQSEVPPQAPIQTQPSPAQPNTLPPQQQPQPQPQPQPINQPSESNVQPVAQPKAAPQPAPQPQPTAKPAAQPTAQPSQTPTQLFTQRPQAAPQATPSMINRLKMKGVAAPQAGSPENPQNQSQNPVVPPSDNS